MTQLELGSVEFNYTLELVIIMLHFSLANQILLFRLVSVLNFSLDAMGSGGEKEGAYAPWILLIFYQGLVFCDEWL